MEKKQPFLYIIGGPNGAGKTTSAQKLLPDFLECNEYVNADVIAGGLSQFNPDSVAITAGRLMLTRIKELAQQKKSFAFETTLASRSFIPLIKNCSANGYTTHIVFLWLPNSDLAVQRVSVRVKKGGHSVSEVTIRRRYVVGLANLFRLYMPVVDSWTLYDNSMEVTELVARKMNGNTIEIHND